MPYGKSYRYRKAYRKYYKRSKTLRKSNIFTNRSAKSQSFQIAALNRKVNRVYRKTKPEYKIVGVTGAHSDFMDSSQVGNTNRQYYQDGPTAGSGDYQRIGDKINCVAYHWYGYPVLEELKYSKYPYQ